VSSETMSAVKVGAAIGLGFAVVGSALYLMGVIRITRNVSTT
jgi:hypothetical protein